MTRIVTSTYRYKRPRLRKEAANASRTFIELLSALDRKRGKGGQRVVRVEHVHVHPGGHTTSARMRPPVLVPRYASRCASEAGTGIDHAVVEAVHDERAMVGGRQDEGDLAWRIGHDVLPDACGRQHSAPGWQRPPGPARGGEPPRARSRT